MKSAQSYGLAVCDPLTQAAQSIRKVNSERDHGDGWAVLRTRHYYGPEQSHRLERDERGEPMRFASRADALAHIADQESGIYYLAHNESGRPDYRCVRVGSRNYRKGLDFWGM